MALFPNCGFIHNPIDCLVFSQAAQDLCLSLEARNRIIATELGAVEFTTWSDWGSYGGSESLEAVCTLWKEQGITSVMPFISTPYIEYLCKKFELKLLAMPGRLFDLRKKYDAYKLFQEIGIPTPETSLLPKGETYSVTSPIGTKINLGAGGMDFRVAQAGEVITANDALVLQEALEIVDSPSVQIVFQNGNYQIVVTDQLIRHNHYCGMTWPSKSQEILAPYGHILANWFEKQGMTEGFLGVDFAITKDDRVLALDLNPRLTAVSFALVKILSNESVVKVQIDQELSADELLPEGNTEITPISDTGVRIVKHALSIKNPQLVLA